MPFATSSSSAAVARSFVGAVVGRDRTALAGLLTEDVWFRCLLPRAIVEHHDRTAALDTIHGWFGAAHALLTEATTHHTSGEREHVGWRLRVRPDWAPGTWHLIEQTGFVRVAGDRIRRVDLVCTGFQAIDNTLQDWVMPAAEIGTTHPWPRTAYRAT